MTNSNKSGDSGSSFVKVSGVTFNLGPRYALKRICGQGGFGIVVTAEDLTRWVIQFYIYSYLLFY